MINDIELKPTKATPEMYLAEQLILIAETSGLHDSQISLLRAASKALKAWPRPPSEPNSVVVTDGSVSVPREPTQEMADAGSDKYITCKEADPCDGWTRASAMAIWHTMLNAAPTIPDVNEVFLRASDGPQASPPIPDSQEPAPSFLKSEHFSYVDVITKGCEGWINLFYHGHCLCMVDNVELAASIRKRIDASPVIPDTQEEEDVI